MKKRNWYAISASQTDTGVVAEVRIYDEIGFWGVTAKDFISQLDEAAASAAAVIVAVNSPGGDVFDAFAIYNALRRYAGKVTSRVDGVAASAASLVVMAGDTVIMPENAMLMIHNPWTIAGGTSDDLRNTADTMDKVRDGIVAAYANRSGQTPDDVQQMMNAETWLTAAEAKAIGFADEIEQPVRLTASISAGARLAGFRRMPTEFMDSIEEVETPVVAPPEAAPPADPPPPAATPSASVSSPPAATPPPVAPPASPAPVASATVDASALAAHVFKACRDASVAHLAEPIIASCGLRDQASVDARIADAREIAGLCLAAKLPESAAEFVASGLNVEQARTRLFASVTAAGAAQISNTQRPKAESAATGAGLSATNIYASRRRAIQAQRS
ncbi:ATP-dependent Clp protease, protease subunit [Paraburkholderia tropica]